MIEETAGRRERDRGLEPEQEILLQPRQQRLEDHRDDHRDEQRPDHPALPADQIVVDEDPRERRHDEARDDETEAAQQDVAQRFVVALQPPRQRGKNIGRRCRRG